MPNNNNSANWGSFLTSAATEGLGTIFGLALEGHNDRRQLKQQQKLQELQIQGQKQMADYNYTKQMEMWQNTSYPAQMEQMKKAGINPALMYGMGGGGGTTTGGGYSAGVNGGNAQQNNNEIVQQQGMALQTAMLQAQIENIKADTNLKQTDATKKAGIDTELGKTQVKSLLTGITNTEAQTSLTNIQKELASIQLKFETDTLQLRETQINYEVSKINEEISILETQKKLDRTTAETKANLLKAELANKAIDTILKHEETKFLKQSELESMRRIQNMIQENMRGWDSMSLEQQKINIHRELQEWETEVPPGLKSLLPSIFVPLGKMHSTEK